MCVKSSALSNSVVGLAMVECSVVTDCWFIYLVSVMIFWPRQIVYILPQVQGVLDSSISDCLPLTGLKHVVILLNGLWMVWILIFLISVGTLSV